MKKSSQASPAIVLNWIARILGILFAIFISLFALDVFEPGVPFGRILIALFMHLVPTYIILILLWTAWKRPLIGGLLFILAGAAYPIMVRGEDLIAFLLIGGIPALIGVLFLASHLLKPAAAR